MKQRIIGDKVFVTVDNCGQNAVIIEIRENETPLIAPASHYKVRTVDGRAFWAFDFEVSEMKDEG